MGKKSAKQVASFLGTSALTRPLFALGAASVLLGAGPANALDSNALPQNPNVVGGKDGFSQSGNTLNVNQSTKRTVIDWRSFDIGSKAQVNFSQPGTSSIAVNRVNASANASQIEGGLHANGQVWILNPNGVFFGKTAHVDAAGIVATTANINDKAFMAGSNKLQMTGADHGSVENQGNISVGANGLAAFVAPSVRNSGTINATVGRVALAAGTTYTLDLAGDHLVELGLGGVNAVVDNSGKIVNPGGTIALSAKAAGQVVNSVVNVSGVVSASSVTKSGGTITLGADNVTTTSTAQLSADAGTNGDGGSITSVANVQGNYAGTFSAKGGSASGNGGSVETSGGSANIDSAIKVNTLAAHGATGKWTIDPTDLLIDSSNVAGYTSSLDSTNVDLLASNSITLNTAFDTSGETNSNTLNFKDEDANGHLTVNLNAPITLGAHQHLIGDADVVNLVQGALLQNGINVVSAAGGTVNLAAGDYAGGAKITGNDVTLNGAAGARILSLTNGVDGVEIFGNNVTVQNLEFAGPADQSYTTFAWGNDITRGIFVENGAQNFNITGNNIHGLRNDILVDGRNTGSITNNTIDNSKSGISVQYTDGTAYDKSLDSSNLPVINIVGNVEGAYGNEWGINYHLNGYWNGVAGDETHPNANPVLNGIYLANAPTAAWQQGMLTQSAANGGMSIQDQAYKTSNRTSVTVSTTGSDTHQGSVLSTLGTIQGGVNAVVAGGTVNVLDGTYVVSAANGYTNGYLGISKSLNLVGQDENGVVIDARNASSYGIRIIGGTDSVTLSNFTLWGVTAAGGYGVKAEDTTNLNINHVTSQGAYKAQFDLNGVRTGEVDAVTANGNGVSGGTGSTKGAAIAITDSDDVTIENSSIIGGSYGGIGIYQSNKAGGYTYQTNNVTIADTNTFDANGASNYNYVYTEDESATHDFGTVTVDGFSAVAGLDANPADTFKYFQTSKANAENYLDSLGAASLGYVEGWTGTAGDNNFAVDTVNGHAMSIQAAVNAASDDATITVGAGTYTGALTLNKANLTLQSADDATDTTIDAGGAANAVTVSTAAGLGTITIDGFTVQDWTSRGIVQDYTGWSADTAAVNATNNIVYGPAGGASAHGNGIEVSGDGSVVSGNQVYNDHLNSVDWSGSGIIAVNGSNITIEDNIVDGADTGIAVVNWNNPAGMSDISVTGNHVSNATDEGISVQSAEGEYFGTASGSISGLTITGNTVSDSASGLGVWDYSTNHDGDWATTVTDVSGNTFDRNTTQISTDFTGADLSSAFSNNTFDKSVLVTGGNTIFSQIQDGVDAAVAGDTINVGDGTYTGDVTIAKSGLKLLSVNGSGSTTIQGVAGTSAEGTIFLKPGSDHTQIGDIGQGFTIVGFDNSNPGSEVSAIYVQGANSGSSIIGNRITAAGDEAILTEYNAAVTGLTIDHNTIDGQTFVGPNPAGQGSSQQFTLWNVPRQAVVIQPGATGTVFTNNTVTTVTGGLNTSGQEQGNNIVAIDSSNATITGNDFAGTTAAWYDALRVRGANDTITGNTFDGANMGAGTNMLEMFDVSGNFDDVLNTNSFINGSVYLDHEIGGENYVFHGINSAITEATAGDTVHVGKGTYNEALNISQSVDIEGAGIGQTIIQPTTLLSTGVGHKYDSNVQAAVYVHDTDGVTLNGLTIDANNLGANAVVFWNNASGTISNSLIENPMAFSGAQTGQGLAVDATAGNTTDLTVSNVTFQNWNKNAIDVVTGDGTGANGGDIVLNVDGSTFNGAGDTGTIAQNGILLWEQGGGSINATVGDSIFSGLSYNDPNTATAAGILAYGSPDTTLTVKDSTFDNTVQEYISTAGGSTNEVDATQGNSFGGVAVASATNDQIFAIEDKITDGIDDTSNGLVRLVAGQVYVTVAKGDIAAGIEKASVGDTVNLQAGTFTLPGALIVDKSVSLVGAGEGATTIDGSNVSGNYAMRVKADDVSLSGFTLEAGVNAWGGMSVFSQSSNLLHDLSISHVTIDDNSSIAGGLLLTGVVGATLDHVTVDAVTGTAAGIQISDSAHITLTNNSTSGSNAGLVIVQNDDVAQQTTDINVDTSNNFANSVSVFFEDDSSTGPAMGSLNIQGFEYAVGDNGPGFKYTELHNGLQDTIDAAVVVDAANSFIQGWTGTGVDNNFQVGTSTGGTKLSINAAVGAANAGGTINVATGTYGEDVSDAKQIAFNFGNVNVNSFTLASGGAGSSLNGNLTATGAIALNGAATVTGNLKAATFASNATLAMTGNLTASGAAALNGASNITGNVAADSLTTGNTLALLGDLTAANGVTFGGASTVTGDISAKTFTANGTLALNGNLLAASITANDAFALNGNAVASGAIALNGATKLAGGLTGGSIALNGATTLTGNTALDTSAANGAIKVASVNGSTAGGQSLAIKAGTGSVSLGNVGATTRLGAVSDASKTTLTGSTYNANSFLFGGDVTLTSATTTLNTTQSAGAAGDITFQGDLFGTTDAAQSLTLIAGPGTGAASANGDITLQNAGTTALNLNNLTVNGDNFTALTVDLAGDYTSQLTGNQVFAADTLNVKGNATSNVGGDASGHIVAGGDVNIVANGDVSGTISGENVNLTGDDVNSVVTANNAANIQGNTVEGSYTANTVTLIASNNVDAAVDATNFTLAANHGSVDGTWTTINTTGSNVVSVNGQTTVGLADLNPNQLVVEGFVLPAGTTIGANGQLILPQGVLLGLLSPGGGKPKMILVHSVQQLGELLAGGYSVIVIDLSNRDSGKPIQLASN